MASSQGGIILYYLMAQFEKVSSVAEFVLFATTICCICIVFATKLVTSYMTNDSLH